MYFAWLREKTGTGQEDLSALPTNVETVADLIIWLKTRSTGHAAAFANPALIRCAVDQEFATPDKNITTATENAFFPPVTGG